MVVCPKCHRSVKKRNYGRHVKDCVPSANDERRFSRTHSSMGNIRRR